MKTTLKSKIKVIKAWIRRGYSRGQTPNWMNIAEKITKNWPNIHSSEAQKIFDVTKDY
jgi:hypothetical protein